MSAIRAGCSTKETYKAPPVKSSTERRNHFKHRLHPVNLPVFTPAKRIGSRPFPKTDIRSGCWSEKRLQGGPARARAIPLLDRPASTKLFRAGDEPLRRVGPNPLGVIRVGAAAPFARERSPDFRVAELTRKHCRHDVSDRAAVRDRQQMACVSVRDWRWRSRLEVGFRNSKALAVVAMQLHLGVERLVEEARKYSNRLEVVRFGCAKCEDAAVFDKEQ
jgi:hypothetical protein